MKKRMMMLLTTVALVMGLTACGDSTASTGNDAASNSTPSLVVEGTTTEAPAEVSPEVTPEPTAEPAPQYTEVTIRDICLWMKSDGNGTTVTIDGEYPDTSLTLAKMWFNVPEGMAVTWEDINKNREILVGLMSAELPGGEYWMRDVPFTALKYLSSMSVNTDYARKDDWTGDFDNGMTREQWESMFTLNRVKQVDGEYSWWSNQITAKTTDEEQQALFVELVNTYTYTEALDILKQASDWANVSDEYRKYCFLADSIHNYFVTFKDMYESGFEAYKADPTGWVDTYAEFKQQ